MLHIGDHIGVKARQGIGTVVEMNTSVFRVEFANGVDPSLYYTLGYKELGTGGVSAAWLYDCPHAEAPVYTPSDGDVRARAYARVIGHLEYRLLDTYQALTHARAALEKDANSGAQWHLAWSQSRIEETADFLANTEKPKGGIGFSYLRDEIYRVQK